MTALEALSEFISEFNRGRFWESHEVLEGAWRHSRSSFFHGLILYASAWVHWERGNRHGVLAQLDKAEPILARLEPRYLGIDVAGLLNDAQHLRTLVEENRLSAVSAPSLRFDKTTIRGDEPELA